SVDGATGYNSGHQKLIFVISTEIRAQALMVVSTTQSSSPVRHERALGGGSLEGNRAFEQSRDKAQGTNRARVTARREATMRLLARFNTNNKGALPIRPGVPRPRLWSEWSAVSTYG
ncbi:Hypothetical predicted protein, partial [Olea europaea subsp. europaea]